MQDENKYQNPLNTKPSIQAIREEASERNIFGNPDIIKDLLDGRVQLVKTDGTYYTEEEIMAMAEKYGATRKNRR